MKTLAAFALGLMIAAVAPAQKPVSPTQTVMNFYRALREKRYVEGFRQSIYRGAIDGLTAAEIQDLEPDFARTFAAIPERIEPRGEQINTNDAIVLLKFDGVEKLEQVLLIKVSGEWLVGDQDSFTVVNSQGRAFFFNSRMTVNEDEAFEMLQRMIGAEVLYSAKFQGRNATLEELIRREGVPKDLDDGEVGGYRFALTISEDKKSFVAAATPVVYGKTGRLSFYADAESIRAEDLKGQPATPRSPIYQTK